MSTWGLESSHSVHGDDRRILRIISPPLGKIRPRIEIHITMVRGEIFDVEDVAHGVLVAWDVDLECVVVVVCKHLEGSIIEE